MATHIDTPLAPYTARNVLYELLAFLKRPSVLVPSGLRHKDAWTALGTLALLHIGGMFLVILPLIAAWQKHFALPMPDAFGKLPSGWLLPITLVIAPVVEETIFRGWQSGGARALWLLGCFIALAVLVAKAKALVPMLLIGALVGLAAIALGGWLWLRRRAGPVPGFSAAYPLVFWAVALVFAGVHLMNYPTTSALSLPMVLPQLWAAALLGFTRQRLGLPASMLQHAIANAASMALAMAGG